MRPMLDSNSTFIFHPYYDLISRISLFSARMPYMLNPEYCLALTFFQKQHSIVVGLVWIRFYSKT